MNNTNEFLQDYMTVAQRARELELNPPHDDENMRTIRNLVLMVLIYALLYMGLWTYFPPVSDGTDSGVGCTDNCLDSLEEDRKP